MNLDEILDDNIILIIPNTSKNSIVKYISSLDKMYNLKIMTFSEVLEHLFFSYDYKTIHYLIELGLNYNTSIKYLENMYYLIDDDFNNRQKELVNLKNELEEHNLLYKDKYFKSSLKNKKIYFYGFNYLSKWQNKVLELLNEITTTTNISDNKNYQPQVFEFNAIKDEITFIANDIIEKSLDLNKVFIANITSSYKEEIRRIFNNFGIPINFKNETTLYDTYYGLNFLNDFNLDNIKDNDIKNLIIDCLNKYYFIDEFSTIKDELKYLFKKTKIKVKKYKNAVNEINLVDNYIDDSYYIYLIGCNNTLPINYKDEDYFSDIVKPSYLDKSYEKNTLEYNKWLKIFKNTKNLTITYSMNTLSGSVSKSKLLNDFNVSKKDFLISKYSNSNNIYNMSVELDNYVKNKKISNALKDLLATYKLNYNTYSNKYQNTNETFSNFNFSYTKLNTFYECSFKYYLEYVLKLRQFDNTFDTYLGSLFHFILSKIYDDNFDFETTKNLYLKDNLFPLTLENKVFLNKTLNELKDFIIYVKSHLEETEFTEIYKELTLEVLFDDVKFTGIIDKFMKKDENVALIDYKTGSININLSTIKSGLNMQLPIYVYLIKKVYPSTKIVGIYLEHIISPLFNKTCESIKLQKEDYYKLTGYSIDNIDVIKDFDKTFEKSKYIKSMTYNDKGFGRFSKVLNEDDFDKLSVIAEEKIKEAIKNIKESNFTINPKILGINNLSCNFCPYKSICFVTEKDYVYIKEDDTFKEDSYAKLD